MGEMPIRKFLDAGVHFSVNSDDPAYFGGYILDNYCAVQEEFSLSIEEWEIIVYNSIEGSWCLESRKDFLRTAFRDCLDNFRVEKTGFPALHYSVISC